MALYLEQRTNILSGTKEVLGWWWFWVLDGFFGTCGGRNAAFKFFSVPDDKESNQYKPKNAAQYCEHKSQLCIRCQAAVSLGPQNAIYPKDLQEV